MSQTIKTYADLCKERKRLQHLLAIQKQRVSDDWSALKDKLSPVRNVMGAVGKMASPDNSNPLVNIGLKVASDVLLKNFVLAKAGWFTKIAVPFVVKNYSSHALADTGKHLFSRVGRFFNRIRRSAGRH